MGTNFTTSPFLPHPATHALLSPSSELSAVGEATNLALGYTDGDEIRNEFEAR